MAFLHPQFLDPSCNQSPDQIYLVNVDNNHFDLVTGCGLPTPTPRPCTSSDNSERGFPTTPVKHSHPTPNQSPSEQHDSSEPTAPGNGYTCDASQQLHLALFNTRGLITNDQNKSAFIYQCLHNQDTHILCLTETWLQKSKHLDADIANVFDNHCVPHRADRDLSRAAIGENGAKMKNGSCLTISTASVPSEELKGFSNGDCEVIISKIHMLNLYLINMYRPPAATLQHFKEALDFVAPTLAEASDTNSNVVLLGDFNFPKPLFDWETHDHITIPIFNPDLQSQLHIAFQSLIKLVTHYNLSQVVGKPTRRDTVLDLVFTNDPDSIIDVAVTPVPNSISDHNFIDITTSYSPITPTSQPPPPPPPEFATFDFPAADQLHLENELNNIDWDIVLTPEMTALDMLVAIEDATSDASSSAGVPKRDPHYAGGSKPKEIKKQWKEKCILARKLGANPHRAEDLRPKILAIDEEIQGYFASKEDAAENKAVASLKDDPGAFFAYVNSKRVAKSHIGPLRDKSKKTPDYIYGPKQMADVLSRQYTSVFSTPLPDKVISDPHLFFDANLPSNLTSIRDITFGPKHIEDALEALNTSATCGPRGLSAFLLHKPANYRPVALTSHVTKTFEGSCVYGSSSTLLKTISSIKPSMVSPLADQP